MVSLWVLMGSHNKGEECAWCFVCGQIYGILDIVHRSPRQHLYITFTTASKSSKLYEWWFNRGGHLT